MNYRDQDGKKFKIQTVVITLTSVLTAAINAILGYIAVYFFKPLWEKIVALLQKKP